MTISALALKHESNPSSGHGAASLRRFYRPELDALRLVAFFLVLLHHMVPLGLGHLSGKVPQYFSPVVIALNRSFGFGLTLFFVLSAFLISELLTRERETSGEVSAVQFYKRRILRIWPLYYFCLAVGLLKAILSPSSPHEIARIAMFAVFMAAWDAASHGWLQNPIAPLWSISLEEQFYIFVPWLFRYLTRVKLMLFGICVIAFSSFWTFHLGQIQAQDHGVWASLLVQSQSFAAGMICSLGLKGRTPRLGLLPRIGMVAASLAVWFVAAFCLHVRYFTAAANPGSLQLMIGYWLGSSGALLMLVGFLGSNPNWFPRWAIYLGRISFGLYAFHEFAVFLVDCAIGKLIQKFAVPAFPMKFIPVILFDVALAAASYHFLEGPFLLRKRRIATVSTEPVGSQDVDR